MSFLPLHFGNAGQPHKSSASIQEVLRSFLMRWLQKFSKIHKRLLYAFSPLILPALDNRFLVNTHSFFFFFPPPQSFASLQSIWADSVSKCCDLWGWRKRCRFAAGAGCPVLWLRAGAVLALSSYCGTHAAGVSTLERKTKAQMCAGVLLMAVHLPLAAIYSMQELCRAAALGAQRVSCVTSSSSA